MTDLERLKAEAPQIYANLVKAGKAMGISESRLEELAREVQRKQAMKELPESDP